MIAALALALAAARPETVLVRTTVMAVRVQVRETCDLSSKAVRCRGAQPATAPVVRVTADGVRTVEF